MRATCSGRDYLGIGVLMALGLALPAAADSFLTCRFTGGGQMRVMVEERGLAIEVPGRNTWLESEEMVSRRDPLVAGFTGPVPGEGLRQAPPHDRFALSLSRTSGEARILFSRRPAAAEVERCRAAAVASLPGTTDQAPGLPPPCEVPVTAGTLTGTCEVQRLKF